MFRPQDIPSVDDIVAALYASIQVLGEGVIAGIPRLLLCEATYAIHRDVHEDMLIRIHHVSVPWDFTRHSIQWFVTSARQMNGCVVLEVPLIDTEDPENNDPYDMVPFMEERPVMVWPRFAIQQPIEAIPAGQTCMYPDPQLGWLCQRTGHVYANLEAVLADAGLLPPKAHV
jgi:hypothetical protein